MLLNRVFRERVKRIISDPAFDKPISDLNKDLSKNGTITLVTRIKPKPIY